MEWYQSFTILASTHSAWQILHLLAQNHLEKKILILIYHECEWCVYYRIYVYVFSYPHILSSCRLIYPVVWSDQSFYMPKSKHLAKFCWLTYTILFLQHIRLFPPSKGIGDQSPFFIIFSNGVCLWNCWDSSNSWKIVAWPPTPSSQWIYFYR